MSSLIFAYGTLRLNGSNHYLLGSSQHVGMFYTKEKYILIKLAKQNFPYLIPASFLPEKAHLATNVIGDLFSVSDEVLVELDSLEGHPHFYMRQFIDIDHIEDNSVFQSKVQCYVLNENIFNGFDKSQIVVLDGDWTKFITKTLE